MRIFFGTMPLFVLLFGFCTAYSVAQDDIPRVSIEELKKMMDTGTDIVLLDARVKEEYDLQHIKGAILFPWKQRITPLDVRSLPRNKPVITYCACGPGDGDSADIARQLLQLGFRDVKVLQDPSVYGWKDAGYPMEGN